MVVGDGLRWISDRRWFTARSRSRVCLHLSLARNLVISDFLLRLRDLARNAGLVNSYDFYTANACLFNSDYRDHHLCSKIKNLLLACEVDNLVAHGCIAQHLKSQPSSFSVHVQQWVITKQWDGEPIRCFLMHNRNAHCQIDERFCTRRKLQF
jgi:hypothetical protein